MASSSTDFFLESDGVRTYSYLLTTTGSHTLGIGIVDASDEEFSSGLLIDSVRLSSVGAVPEPSTSLMAGLAAILLAFRRTRRWARRHPA